MTDDEIPQEIHDAAEKYAQEAQEHLNAKVHPGIVPAWGPLAGAWLAGYKAAMREKE